MVDAAANDALDALEACPCCLLGPQQRCLKTPYTHLDNTETYSDMLKECFNIQLDVASDKCGICEECAARLRDASHFKRQVQRSQAQLQERLARALKIIEEAPPVTVKSETADEDGTINNLSGEELADDMAGGGGAAILQVKEEVVEHLKEEWEDSAAFGVSETAALVELYAGHEVKDELVLGPEGLQPQDIVFTLYAAQAINVKDQRVPRDCVVRLERDEHVEALLKSKTHSNTNIATDSDTFLCDVCGKRFALQTQLMEHAMIHIRQSSEREGTRGVADDEPHRDHTYAKTGPTLAEGNLKNAEMGTALEQKASVSRQVSVTNEDVGEVPGVKHSKTANITKKTTPYKCSRCSYATAFKSIILRHEREHTGEKPYKCNRCSYASANKSNLLVHERKHTGEKPYKCNRCSYASANKSNLLDHERKHTGEKPYKCNRCSYASTKKSHLLGHERKHSGQKPYRCNRCSFSTAFKSSFLRHESKHTGEKLYKCNHCSYASGGKSNLLVHERKHTGEKPYKCNRCSYASANKSNLLVHEIKHTGEKPYKCGQCSYASAQKSNLLVHERKHTGEKPYKCNRCSYASARESHLLAHETKHTGEKPYKCGQCSYASAYKSNLNVHERKHDFE